MSINVSRWNTNNQIILSHYTLPCELGNWHHAAGTKCRYLADDICKVIFKPLSKLMCNELGRNETNTSIISRGRCTTCYSEPIQRDLMANVSVTLYIIIIIFSGRGSGNGSGNSSSSSGSSSSSSGTGTGTWLNWWKYKRYVLALAKRRLYN